jgi:hypothetical protein
MNLFVFVLLLAGGLVYGAFLAGVAAVHLRTGSRSRPAAAATLAAGLLLAGGSAGIVWWGYQKFYVDVPQPTPAGPLEVYAAVFGAPPPDGVEIYLSEEQVYGSRTWRYLSLGAEGAARRGVLEGFAPATIDEYIGAYPLFDESLDAPSIAPETFVPFTSGADRFYRRDPERVPGATTWLTQRLDDGRIYVVQDVRP